MHDESRQPDTNDSAQHWDALARFVAGESDVNESRTVEAWLALRPVDAALVQSVKAHADGAEASLSSPVQVDAAWHAVRARMTEAAASPHGVAAPTLSVVRGAARELASAPRTGADRPGMRWGRVALAVAATLVAFVGLRAWQGGGAGTVAHTQVLATRVGQRDSVTLSDGTRIVLAPGSRVTVAAGFAAGDRSVTLDGAAYFDVQHDAAHPFLVRAAGAEIRDIGTRFTVNTDASGGVSVSVTHGIVAIGNAASSAPSAVELHAGDRGTVHAGTVAVTRGTVSEDALSWMRGQLVYRDTPLAEVQADFKRWYGVNLVVTDSALAGLTVTGPVQQDSARVVSWIATMLGADAEQRGDTVILRSAGRGTIP